MPAKLRLPFLIEGLAWLLLIVVAVGWSASNYLPDFGGDAAVYWLTANYWSPYGAPVPSAASVAMSSIYPPLYPASLAIFGGGSSLMQAHVVTVGMLLAALIGLRAFYLSLGIPRPLALLLPFIVALLPLVRWEAIDLHSEPLYFGLSLAALALALGRSSQPLPWPKLFLIGLLISSGILTRSVGVALLGAATLHAIHRREPRWILPIALGGCAWMYNSLAGHSTGGYLQQLFAKHADSESPVFVMLNGLLRGYLEGVNGPDTPLWLQWSSLVVLPLALLATARRIYCGFLDGYYVLCYLAVIVLWPFPAEAIRFLMPIVPILLGQIMHLLATLTSSWSNQARLLTLSSLPLLLALIILPDTIRIAVRWATPLAPAFAPFKRTRDWYMADVQKATFSIANYATLHELLKRTRDVVPPDECVFAIKPAIVSLYSQRRAYMPPLPKVPDSQFAMTAAESNCKYFLLLNMASPTVPIYMYPYSRIVDQVEVLINARNPVLPAETAGALVVWRNGR